MPRHTYSDDRPRPWSPPDDVAARLRAELAPRRKSGLDKQEPPRSGNREGSTDANLNAQALTWSLARA